MIRSHVFAAGLAATVSLSLGCAHGPWRIRLAAGEVASLRTRGDAELHGELLGVGNDGVFLLSRYVFRADGSTSGGRITYSSFRALDRVRLEGKGSMTFRADSVRYNSTYIGSPKMLQRTRYYSRYPTGLDQGRVDALLRAYGQETLDTFPAAEASGRQSLDEAALSVAERLASPEAAAAEGYHVIGPDFPGMGQHWTNLQILMSGALDPARPAVLSYTELNGKLTLVSVAHAAVLSEGESPPDLAGIPASAWHSHAGTVQDEMLSPHGAQEATRGLRVSMLHVWTIPNPDGLVSQHNWLLPFLRLGLPSPEAPVRESAAQALALATPDGLAYNLDVVHALFSGDAEADALRTMRGRAADAARLAEGFERADRVAARDLTQLEDLWRQTGEDLVRLASDAAARAQVMRVYGVDDHAHGGNAGTP